MKKTKMNKIEWHYTKKCLVDLTSREHEQYGLMLFLKLCLNSFLLRPKR